MSILTRFGILLESESESDVTDLVIEDCAHTHTAPNLTVEQIALGQLTVQESDHIHDADSLVLIQHHILTVADCYHVHAPPNIDITESLTLIVAESSHVLTSDKITPDYRFIEIDDAFHSIVNDYVWLDTSFDINWGLSDSTPDGGSGLITTTKASGGYLPSYPGCSFTLTGCNIWAGSVRTGQIRLALYQGGDFTNGPAGSTLIKDFGRSTGTGANQWVHIGCPDLVLDPDPITWLSCKDGDSDFYVTYNRALDGGLGDFNAYGYYTSESITPDDNVAYPSSWSDPDSSYVLANYALNANVEITISTNSALQIKPAVHELLSDEITNFNKSVKPDESYHLVVSESADIEDFYLNTQDCYHLHYADEGLNALLAPENCYHLHDVDASGAYPILTAQDCYHLHNVDAVTITIRYILSVEDCYHLHDIDSVALTQAHQLLITGDDLLNDADNIALSGYQTVTPDDCYHINATDASGAYPILDINEAYSLHVADNIDISQGTDLVIAESSHVSTSDNINGLTIVLTQTNDSAHVSTSDNIVFSGTQNLTIQESHHLHDVESINIWMVGDIAIQNAWNQVDSNILNLSGVQYLVVADAYHRHFIDSISFGQVHNLYISSPNYHLHYADAVIIPSLPVVIQESWVRSATTIYQIGNKS